MAVIKKKVFITDFKKVTRRVTGGAGTDNSSGAPDYQFIPVFSVVRVAQSLVLCVEFRGSLFVLLYFFFFWPLYCLSFHCRPLVALFASSNFHSRHKSNRLCNIRIA